MLGLPPSVRIYFATELTDMRNGIDGLRAIVESALRRDPYEGHLFVFVGKAKDKVKILFWDRSGSVRLVGLVCPLIACVANAPPRAPSPPAVRPQGAAARLSLSSCEIPDLKRSAKCGTAHVFENRALGHGRVVPLKVIVVPATQVPAAADRRYGIIGRCAVPNWLRRSVCRPLGAPPPRATARDDGQRR